MIYLVRYHGPFGFIKPWTAVRDTFTHSQTFLTPSIIEGMRQKLEVSAISRHRLRHRGLNVQQERTQSAGWKANPKQMSRSLSIIERGVMLQPELFLAFPTIEDAEKASTQHLCLCRNEDVLFPSDKIEIMDEVTFDKLPGIELQFEPSSESSPEAFLVGYNRFDEAKPMYGRLVIVEE